MTDLKISQFANGGASQPTDQIATNRGGINTYVSVGSMANEDAADYPQTADLAAVAFSGQQSDLLGLGTGVATFLATPTSANLRAALTDEVGTGAAYFVGGALGTPASGTATNLTGLPISTGVSGLGTGVATFLATPSSANLAAAVTGETGTGGLVFDTDPALTRPVITGITSGAAAASGVLGEKIESTVLVGSRVSLTSGATTNITSISLTAGQWIIWYGAHVQADATTVLTVASTDISTTSATLGTAPSGGGFGRWRGSVTGSAQVSTSGFTSVNISSTTTYYLACAATFTTSTAGAYGYIGAVRIR